MKIKVIQLTSEEQESQFENLKDISKTNQSKIIQKKVHLNSLQIISNKKLSNDKKKIKSIQKINPNSKLLISDFSKTFSMPSKLQQNKISNQSSISKLIFPLSKKSNQEEIDLKLDISESSQYTIDLIKNPDIDISNKYKYFVGPGNNDKCIKRLMKKREWWVSSGEYKRPILNKNNKMEKKKDFHNLKLMQDADFTWVQSNKESNYENMKASNKFRMFNHFPIHPTISSKYNLMKNYSETCHELGLNVFSFLPLTFALDRDSLAFQKEFTQFLNFFKKFSNEKKEIAKEEKKRPKTPIVAQKMSKNFLKQKLSNYKVQSVEKEIKSKYCKNKPIINYNTLKIPNTFNADKNIWLIKPQGYNRGFGVELFDDLKELKVLMNNMLSGYTEKLQIDKDEIKRSNKSIKSRKFVIQKYIEKPLLYKNKKFDMR